MSFRIDDISVIYAIVNLVNNKKYIGSAKEMRLKISEANKGRKHTKEELQKMRQAHAKNSRT